VLRRSLVGLVALALVLIAAAGSAAGASPAERPDRPTPSGSAHDAPYPSPLGVFLRGAHHYGVIIAAEPAERGRSARAYVDAFGAKGEIRYSVPADLSGEGIHANLGHYGRVDLRWVPNGRVREITGHCAKGLSTHEFFAAGSYVGTVRFRGGGGFTAVTAHRIAWRRGWYGKDHDCPHFISEGFPGPGTILDAGRPEIWGRIHLDAIQDGPGDRVAYQASSSQTVGRMSIVRSAYVLGGPKTITVGPGFRTADVKPPAPFSGTGRFEKTEHAHGSWLGDLSVAFPDGTYLRLAGSAFDATLHSGYDEVEK
jgi:hypothetical protein